MSYRTLRGCLGALALVWITGYAEIQTRAVTATALQAEAIRDIFGAQLPACPAGPHASFIGSQRPGGHLALAVGCK